jgi:hypothetical protein
MGNVGFQHCVNTESFYETFKLNFFRLNTKHNAAFGTVINPLKTSGNYIYHRLLESVIIRFVFMDLLRFSP